MRKDTDSINWLTLRTSTEFVDSDIFRSDWLPHTSVNWSSSSKKGSITWKRKPACSEILILKRSTCERNEKREKSGPHQKLRIPFEQGGCSLVSPRTMDLQVGGHHQVKIPLKVVLLCPLTLSATQIYRTYFHMNSIKKWEAAGFGCGFACVQCECMLGSGCPLGRFRWDLSTTAAETAAIKLKSILKEDWQKSDKTEADAYARANGHKNNLL